MHEIRRCRPDEGPAILRIVNAGAEAYRGVIPPDRRHDPYMSASHLEDEIVAGVEFWNCQPVRDVDLIRHGFEPVPAPRAAELLKSYWNIPERQIETSVVLAHPP